MCFKGQWLSIYLCASSDHSQILSSWVQRWCWSQDYLQQTISEQLIQLEHQLTLRKGLIHTHTPTRSGTHRREGTYTLRRAGSWRCVLCNSRVKWSKKHPPDLSNRRGCQLRAGWGCWGGADINDEFRSEHVSQMSFGFQHISVSLMSREDLCAVAQ